MRGQLAPSYMGTVISDLVCMVSRFVSKARYLMSTGQRVCMRSVYKLELVAASLVFLLASGNVRVRRGSCQAQHRQGLLGHRR